MSLSFLPKGCVLSVLALMQCALCYSPQAVGEWASSLESSALLETAAGYVDDALSCGYTGLVMLHGFIAAK